jgi:hypothetical protein
MLWCMMRWITHSSSYLYMSVYFILSLDTNLPKSPLLPVNNFLIFFSADNIR